METKTMEVELGKPVVTSDGEKVGTVDRLVIDPDSRTIREFLVQQGTLLTSDRIVEGSFVDRIDADGTVYLTLTEDQVESLPEFVEHHYHAPGDQELGAMPHAWIGGAGGAGGGPLFWGPLGPGRGEAGRGLFFEPAPANPIPKEPDDSLREDEIVIDEGTNVLGRDGDKIGTVEEISYDANGKISGFTVKSGLIFSHDVHVPISWVDSIRTDAVQLSVTAEEAESSGAVE
jgi:uncharacterized protein YrrD